MSDGNLIIFSLQILLIFSKNEQLFFLKTNYMYKALIKLIQNIEKKTNN